MAHYGNSEENNCGCDAVRTSGGLSMLSLFGGTVNKIQVIVISPLKNVP